jgi:peptide/nickel transport system permease protein
MNEPGTNQKTGSLLIKRIMGIKTTIIDFMKLAMKKKTFFAGFTIVSIMIFFSILDMVYPEYLGVSNTFTLFSFTNSSNYFKFPTPPTLSNGIYGILGTSMYQIPILPVLLASLPIDIGYAFLTIAISSSIGISIGLLAVYPSESPDHILMRITDTFMAIPILIGAMIFAFEIGFSFLYLSLGISFILWSYYAKLMRNSILQVKSMNYVEASIASGASKFRIAISHLIPNAMTPILVRMSIDFSTVIIIIATVNFLFPGAMSKVGYYPELGNAINGFQSFGVIILAGYPYFTPPPASTLLLSGYWWAVFIPGLFLLLLIMGFSLLSDGLMEILDPKMRSY